MQLSIAKDATIPAGVTLRAGSGPTRAGDLVSAEWSFDAPTDGQPYREQADGSLRRAGYEPVATANDEAAYAGHVPGDAHRILIVRDTSTARVTVTFRAGPIERLRAERRARLRPVSSRFLSALSSTEVPLSKLRDGPHGGVLNQGHLRALSPLAPMALALHLPIRPR